MPRCSTMALLFLLTLAGCRQANPDVEMLESELRWLEDQVYLLDQQLQVKAAELESARRSNTSLKNLLATQQSPGTGRRSSGGRTSGGLGGGGLEGVFGGTLGGSDLGRPPTPAAPRDRLPPGSSAPRIPPSRAPRPERAGTDDDQDLENDDLKPPSVDLGEGASEDPVNSPDSGDSSQYVPATGLEGPMLLASAERRASRSGLRLVLNPRVTGGCDLDDCPGDDGLMVLVQTVDSTGQPLKVLGPVTLELRDPNGEANTPPLGHWDIDASVVATRYGKTLFGEGVHLQLPWSDAPPPSGTWQLTATLLTEDGEWLSDQRRIPIEVAGDLAGHSAAHQGSGVPGDPRQPWGPQRPATLYGVAGVPSEPSLLPSPTDDPATPLTVAVPTSEDGRPWANEVSRPAAARGPVGATTTRSLPRRLRR